jgi:hypothetical protein
MPRRLITQPPLLREAGWESRQVLRVRVWTHVTQNVHGARQPSVFQPFGMGRLGLGKRLCVFAVVCVLEPTWFSQTFRNRRRRQRNKLTRAVSAGTARGERLALALPAYHHVKQHAVIVKPLALLKALCHCARKRAAWPPDCHHGGQRLRGVHAQLGRRAACPRAERVCDRRSRPADLVAAARGRAAEPCSALRRAVTHWQAAASRELVRRALPPADGLGATAAAIALRLGRI